MSRVRIVTDSTSDLPPEVAARLRITVVPAYVQIGNRSFRDAHSAAGISREEFYTRLPTMSDVPTTAVPPAGEFAAVYRSLIGEADEVIVIVVAASLSGMYSVAHLGAHEVPDLKVHVVDSGQTTMGLGWMVIAAAEAAAAGRSAQEIRALIEDVKHRVHVYAMLDTLEYLRRSGRVSWARAKAAQVLRIKPIVELISGEVRDVGRTRTRRRAIERLVELTRALGPLERLAILHTHASEVEELHHRLSDLCAPEQLLTVAVTTIIGAHVGPQGLGVAAVSAK
ncbi:MAG: DegV family EDD domain-containing protein [Anaerolineae bacterium]|nr:DegV family EDD domain-containing protein [Anaerolineae bacterium]